MSTVQRSEHDRKYDRQMRLWGGHGQRNLEEAHICVLGAGPSASETLKNLVLPNVGQFTLVDNQKVTERDLGNNFFVTENDLNNSRAKAVTNWLVEMNDGVKGHPVERDPADIITKEIGFFDKFNIVIATELWGDAYVTLGKYLYSKNIPFVGIRTNGLVGQIRVQVEELTIMESHPTNDRTDFYIYKDQLENFKELKDYINSFDIDPKDIYKKGHTPCIAILGQYTEKWLKEHNGKLPSNYKEQEQFKDGIRTLGDEENFFDAVRWAYQCYIPPRIDKDIKQVLNDKKGEKLEKNSSDFWILVKSLRDFMKNEGKGFLPMSTNIPDITCDPQSYVKLKKIYKARAQRDYDLILKYTQQNLKSIGRKEDSIPDFLVDRFVKNVRSLKFIRTRSIENEINSPDNENISESKMNYDMNKMMQQSEQKDDENVPKPHDPWNFHWYLAFRTLDQFYNKEKRLPGNKKDNISNDVKILTQIQKENILKSIKVDDLEVDEHVISEITRYGGTQIHNTAAFIGGSAASLVMKLLLRQFFPFNHTMIYNGISCAVEVFAV